MCDTQEKLEEAKYFLHQMESDLINISHFKFNLSAFLSAARSVTFIMQNEFSEMKGFSDWYGSQQKKFEKNPLMKMMNEKRRISIHQVPIRPRKETHVTHHDQVTLTDSLTAFVLHADGSAEIRQSEPKQTEKIDKIDPEVKHLWYFDDFDSKDVITLCTEYLDLLKNIVSECQSKI